MPKTGGHFCIDVLSKYGGQLFKKGGWHAPFARVPQEFRALPVLVVTRNPWDWYVSWYHYMIDMLEDGNPNPLIANAALHTPINFNSIMNYVFESIKTGTPEARQLDSYMESPQHLSRRTNLPGMLQLEIHMLKVMRKETCGFLSWRFHELTAGVPVRALHCIEFSDLNKQLVATLENIGIKLSEQEKTEIIGSKKINAGASRKEAAYRDFYAEPHIKEKIAQLDSKYIDMLNYQF